MRTTEITSIQHNVKTPHVLQHSTWCSNTSRDSMFTTSQKSQYLNSVIIYK